MKYLVVILLFIAAFFKVPDINGWAYRQVAGLFVLSLVISWLLSKKYHISVGLCFLVTAIFGLIQSGLPQFGSEVVSSVMTLLFFSCIALCLEGKYLAFIFPILMIIAILDSVIMIFRALPHIGDLWGFLQAWWVMTNASLDACFIALMSPVVGVVIKYKTLDLLIMAFILIAVLLTKSNTAICVFVLMQLIIFLKQKDYKSFLIIFIGLASLAVPFHHFFGMKFAANFGRFGNWKTMMGFWKDHINHIIGAGPGTYWVYSQAIQAHKVGDGVFTWMHNDYLQVLFEQGYIGLVSILFLYGVMLYKSFKGPVLFSMVIGYGLIACTMYPLHLFYFQLIGVALIYHCFVKTEIACVN